jgi:membrane protein
VVADGITGLSAILLVASVLTLSRGLQRLYQSAYGLPSVGWRGTPWGLLWLALVPLFVELRHLMSMVSHGVFAAVFAVGLAAVGWTVTPYVLLGRRLSWSVLLPGGLLAGAAMSALTVGSIVYMPHSVASSAAQYGLIGVAFAILGWLIACGFVLVGTATAGAVLVRRGP